MGLPHCIGNLFVKSTYRIDKRKFFELRPGEKFAAVLLDIRPGEMLIQFFGGGTYKAKSLVLPNAHIGDACIFMVKENDMNGRIVLEVVKDNRNNSLKKYDIRV